MPAVQKYFQEFHDRIKLDNDDEKAKLRDKRERLVQTLRDNLPGDVPSFEKFDQGSYSMHTGVLPSDGNYDIDVGIIFDCKIDKYPDPILLKMKVRDALDTHGRTVVIRRPCVTVNYMRDGVVDYHVDLAIYVKRGDELLDLAKGKENSAAEHRVWEPSDPKSLTSQICGVFSAGADLAQYRRCIRYVKRWRNVQFANGGAPLSIALTVAAQLWFKPKFALAGNAEDLLALLAWIKAMLAQFHSSFTDEGSHERLEVPLPVLPYTDLMAGLTKLQMEIFRSKLEALQHALTEAYDEELPEEACKLLNKQFGDDFTVPEKQETAKAVSAPFISSGTSA